MDKNVGFIGLGVMGTAFVQRLLEMKVVPIVYDVVPQKVELLVSKGAISADSPKDVAAQSDIVMTSLPDPAIVNKVHTGENGILDGVRKGMVIFDLSTVDPVTTRENYKKFAEKGASLLDSPVSGGPPEIIEGRLPSIMVGGDEEVFKQYVEYLKLFSNNVHYVGGSGCGNVVKLTNNLMSLTNNAIAAEAMVFGTKAGVDPDVLHDILSHSGCRSIQLVHMYPNLMKRNFEPGFRLNLGKKDVGLALDMAKSLNQPMFLGSIVFQVMSAASALGYGEEECIAVAKLYEKYAGIEVTGKGETPEPGLI